MPVPVNAEKSQFQTSDRVRFQFPKSLAALLPERHRADVLFCAAGHVLNDDLLADILAVVPAAAIAQPHVQIAGLHGRDSGLYPMMFTWMASETLEKMSKVNCAGGHIGVGAGGDAQRVVFALLELPGQLEEDGVLQGEGRFRPFVRVSVDLGLSVNQAGVQRDGVVGVVSRCERVAGDVDRFCNVQRRVEGLEHIATASLMAHIGTLALSVIFVLDGPVLPVHHQVLIVNRAHVNEFGTPGRGAHAHHEHRQYDGFQVESRRHRQLPHLLNELH